MNLPPPRPLSSLPLPSALQRIFSGRGTVRRTQSLEQMRPLPLVGGRFTCMHSVAAALRLDRAEELEPRTQQSTMCVRACMYRTGTCKLVVVARCSLAAARGGCELEPGHRARQPLNLSAAPCHGGGRPVSYWRSGRCSCPAPSPSARVIESRDPLRARTHRDGRSRGA